MSGEPPHDLGTSSGGETTPEVREVHPEPVHRPRIWPRVVGVLVLLAGAGGAWLWQNPDSLRLLFPASAAHDTELKSLSDRVARLEQRPVPASADDLSARVDALEKRLSQPGPSGQVDLRPLMDRLDALEAQTAGQPAAAPATGSSGADMRVLRGQLDTLRQQVAEHQIDPAKVAALAAQVDALSARDPASALGARLDDLEHQVTALTAKQAGVEDIADKAARLGRVESAEIALAAGQPLGPLPDAPEALTRFATAAPPTAATLRLAFPPAAQAALAVSQPDAEGKPFLDRVMERLQDSRLITVREGDHVLIGNTTAAILTRAQTLLEAGDLNGAVRAAGELSGLPAQKMAAWLADARALIAAREALASLAGNG
jgi:polyhydroxyalkanoate synthesis regulator phasin